MVDLFKKCCSAAIIGLATQLRLFSLEHVDD
jgi:hypothetical protein